MAAAASGGGGGGSGTPSPPPEHTKELSDIEWEKDEDGERVVLGRGVYAGTLHGQPVAIKAELMRYGEEAPWLEMGRLRERATCPHIVAVYGIIVDRDYRYWHSDRYYTVMEQLAGTMTSRLLTPGGAHYGADMKLRLALLADVAAGLAYLHSRGIIHGDIKPDSVLLTAVSWRVPVPTAKLADFGPISSFVGDYDSDSESEGDRIQRRGMLVYMDPVLFDRARSITTASDVYSFGIMAWQVLTGLQPYAAEFASSPPTSVREMTERLRAHVRGPGGGRPPLAVLSERGAPPDVVALVQSCWAPAQADRPTMAAVQRALAAAAAAKIAPSPAPAPTLPDEYLVPFGDLKWDKDADDEKIVLGRGTYGIVYAGRLHGQAVAIKYEVIDNAVNAAAWTATAVLHMRSRCPHIAVMQGATVRTAADSVAHYYSVMERLAGTLTALLLKPGSAHYGASVALRLQLLADVAGGLAYLHSRDVIHADVKPDNVLLTAVTPRAPFPTAKLADFGSSVLRRADTKTRETLMGERGTMMYMDPCLLDGSASLKNTSDVFSFGVMAWQVLCGQTPYAAEIAAAAPTSEADAVAKLRAHVCGPRGKRPPAAALSACGVPPSVVALVESCWAPAQGDRPTMAGVQSALEAAAAAVARVAAR